MSKFTFEFVQEKIAAKGDILLSTKYEGNKKLLDIRCGKCNVDYRQTFKVSEIIKIIMNIIMANRTK